MTDIVDRLMNKALLNSGSSGADYKECIEFEAAKVISELMAENILLRAETDWNPAIEAAAQYCEKYMMESAISKNQREFADFYTAIERVDAFRVHHGMGYADAIRKLKK